MEMLLVEKYRKEAEALRTQLEKANESVKYLEGKLYDTECCLLSSNDDLAKANERAAELENSNARMLHEVANQYDGNDSTEWSIGANHVFKLFAKWIHKSEQLRKEQE